MQNYKKRVYKSKQWQIVRKAVIDRDRDICFFCGKIILKRRTIHHIKEIDESNFDDWEVAFNLDNLVECHSECHNIHHDRFGYQKRSIVNDELEIDYSKRKEN